METTLITHFQPEQNLFNYTIKSHYLLHFGMVGAYVNPILGACHQGEDLMKVAKRMVCTSAGGSGALASTKKAMQKYMRGLALDLTGAMR